MIAVIEDKLFPCNYSHHIYLDNASKIYVDKDVILWCYLNIYFPFLKELYGI